MAYCRREEVTLLLRQNRGEEGKMYNLRGSYPFDGQFGIQEWKYGGVFAASPDKRTFYVKAGANDGVRYLAHTDGKGCWWVGDRLHAAVLRAVEGEVVESLRSDLRKAADAMSASPATLVPIAEVPGFVPPDTQGEPARVCHKQGWYTCTEYALPLPAPTWAPDAQAWDIAEGVYLRWEDGSIRLVPRREYYDFCQHIDMNGLAVVARQGDCLAFERHLHADWVELDRRNGTARVLLRGEPWAGGLDHHQVVVEDGKFVLRHLEHGRLGLPAEARSLVLMPGTSRPFSRDGGVD